MEMCKFVALRWSIFTLSMQLVYCASVNSHYDHTLRQQRQLHIPTTAAQLAAAAAAAAVATEPICSDQYVHEREVHASLTLDLHPSATVPGPCKTVLTAPDSNVFIVRLHRTRAPRPRLGPPSMMTGSSGGSGARSNSTRSCPLSIISTSDPLKSPWKIDPCLLEDMSTGMAVSLEDPVQMLPGRLRIIWHHGGNAPNYRLIITALGKGQNCLQTGKHACMRFGSEIMLCISDSLVCDGIRHCPTGNGYESDEDTDMCLRNKLNQPTHPLPSEIGLWQQISNELKKIIPSSSTEAVTDDAAVDTTTTNAKPTTPHRTTTATSSSDVHRKKEARDRTSLTRGLSRYGPWGYLMLGMLLCGGALLMCGMWECCCRTKKPDPNGDDPVAVSTGSGHANDTLDTQNGNTTLEPPNYDEIDPPPSYAALFPNQKSESTSAQSSGSSSATTVPSASVTTTPTVTAASTMTTTDTSTYPTTTTTVTAAIATITPH